MVFAGIVVLDMVVVLLVAKEVVVSAVFMVVFDKVFGVVSF